MTHYIIAEITIADREEYARYEAGFMAIFSRYQGKMLAVDEQPESLEGQWPHTRTVLVEFPDREHTMAWYQSADYQALAQHRRNASEGNLVLIKGLE
ncbi:MAG: hypothetical protein ACI9WS_002829 [Paraglaciecola psychrophila]|jgi:uncharacterized protein (DUF1330 family)